MTKLTDIPIDDIQTGIVKHDTLSEELILRIRNFKEKLGEVEPSTIESAIDNFKEDTHPENEVAMWESMAEVFELATKRKEFSFEKRREIFKMLLIASSREIHNSDIEKPELVDYKEAQIIEAHLVHSLKQNLGKDRNPITVRRHE